MPSTEVLHAILRATPGAMLAVDGDGAIVFVNDEAAALFGWAADELVGRPVERLVPPRLSAEHVERRAAFDGRHRSRAGAGGFPARRRDGSEFHAEIELIPAAADEGGEQLVVVAVRPVGDGHEAERQRQASLSQREQQARLESLGQLAGGVAHEFNNLLGVILNYTSLLDSQATEPMVKSDLAEIRKAGERAAELTRQLLSFARRDSSNPEPVDVGALVREAAPSLEQCLGEGIDLLLEVDDGPLVASADHRQLEQILLHLAVNAREAMPIGGLVRLRVRAEADPYGGAGTILIEVVDTGVGMSADVAGRAFEPFFTTKPDSDGHGLGLATVHGTIRRHGGRVSLESTVGAGTTVRIELPATAPRPAPAGDEGGGRRGMGRILLAEDEDALRSATDRLLTAEGYEVLAARDGVEAIEIFEREGGAVDLLLSDVVMPRMRGDELARRLVDRAPSLPVVLVSGHDFGEAALLGRMLDKPVSTPDLLRTIREVLDG
jgi:PAS domain S-box-containing protein